jgi:hypothetical protein
VRVGDDRIVVVLYRLDLEAEHLVAYTFGATTTGLIDLLAMHVESAAGCTAEDAYRRAQHLGRGLPGAVPARGLRSREVRSAVSQHGLIQRAQQYIEHLATNRDPMVRKAIRSLLGADQVRVSSARDTRLTDAFLARFVLDYAAALAEGRTRAEVGAAQVPPVSAKAIEAWIRKATDRGLWVRSGQSGKVGHPHPRASEIAGRDGA